MLRHIVPYLSHLGVFSFSFKKKKQKKKQLSFINKGRLKSAFHSHYMCLFQVNTYILVLQQEAQKRLISQGTHDEKVTLCVIYQNFPHILTDSNLLDATLGNYYKWKGQRSKVKGHGKRSNTEKYSIFFVYPQILHINFRFFTHV